MQRVLPVGRVLLQRHCLAVLARLLPSCCSGGLLARLLPVAGPPEGTWVGADLQILHCCFPPRACCERWHLQTGRGMPPSKSPVEARSLQVGSPTPCQVDRSLLLHQPRRARAGLRFAPLIYGLM